MRQTRTKWRKPFSTSEIGQRLEAMENEDEEWDHNYYHESEVDNTIRQGWFRKLQDLTTGSDHNLEQVKLQVEADRKEAARLKKIENAIQERRRKGNLWNTNWEERKGGAE